MAAFTAQILVGAAHPNHGGITPTHHLYLSENSRPIWLLFPNSVLDGIPNALPEKVTWIPTVENLLEDALLMIAIHVVGDLGISDAAGRLFRAKAPGVVALQEDIDRQDLEHLYEKLQAADIPAKLVLTAMHGSTVMRHLKVLEKYRMDVEVCIPQYSRSYSRWQEQVVVKGTLDDVLPS